MKIKCEFCGTMMDDTQSVCPSCGAPNRNVRRSSGDQPLTIEELRQWYEGKGLPPEEVTRFFIGKDIREPKAFGIYYEEDTGNYVVYKNKASGERSVRYRGTDQAYAVNELFQRLKQEIIQQKMLNVKKRQEGTDAQRVKAGKRAKGLLGNLLMIVGIIGAIAVCFTVFLTVYGLILTRNDPLEGYYAYNNTDYYYSGESYSGLNWFCYSAAQKNWQGPLGLDLVPDALETRKESKPYYLQEKWSPELPCSNFQDSVYARDIRAGGRTESGYYHCNSGYYYHLTGIYDDDWYYFDDDTWQSVDYAALPEQLQHPSAAQDFYYTPVWDAETQLTDFEDSPLYQQIVQTEPGETEAQTRSDSDSDFNWDSNDSWDSGDTDWDSDW